MKARQIGEVTGTVLGLAICVIGSAAIVVVALVELMRLVVWLT